MKIQSTTSTESAELVHQFLNGHYSGVLATSDRAGNPLATVVYFSLQDDYSITFGTKSETQKYKNIEENRQVAFVVYDEVEQTTVQISGYAEVVTDPDKRQKVLNNMFISSAQRSLAVTPPVEKLWAGSYVALRIVPMVIKMAIYNRPNSDGEDLYETMLFSE